MSDTRLEKDIEFQFEAREPIKAGYGSGKGKGLWQLKNVI
jgi:hypothetical protein